MADTTTSLDFGEFCLKFDQSLKRTHEIPEIERTLTSVMLNKRFRGETWGDRIGRWNYHGSTLSASTVTFAEPQISGLTPINIYTKNIVKPKVRGNASVMAQAKISVKCEPRREETRAKKNALIAQKVSDWTDDTLWTESLALDINIAKQLAHGVFLKSTYNPQKEGRKYKKREWGEETVENAPQVACKSCGWREFAENAPLPEAQSTIEAQIAAVLDINNPKVAVLLTDQSQVELLPDEAVELLIPIGVEEGLLCISQEKTGFDSPETAQAYLDENGYGELLGKVEDLTGASREGATIRTADKDDNELMSSVVTDINNLPAQAQVDAAQFPEGTQEIIPASEALEKRNLRQQLPTSPPCALCGGETEIIEAGSRAQLPALKETEETEDGDNDLEVIPALEMQVDERYSQGATLKKCRYVVHRRLMSRFEIEHEFGCQDFGEPTDWCFPLKWLYTLQTGISYPFGTFKQTDNVIRALDMYEVRRIYFTPEFLACAVSDKEFRFRNEKDKSIFKIKAMENPRDVVLAMAKKAAADGGHLEKGLCVAITGDKILGFKLADFRTQFTYTYFLSNPFSFWGLCYSELETHQHLVNQLYTAIMNQVQENKNKIAVDGEAFDDEDLDGDSDIIHRRQDYDKPMRDSLMVIEGVPVTADAWTAIQYAEKSADDVSLVNDEMLGQPSGVKTLGQAEINRDMSIGTLTPAQQSTASAKVGVCHQHCLIAMRHWTPERLAELCMSQDSTITDEDIERFFTSDLDADVVFSYIEGSEMPKTQIQKQRDIFEYSQFLAELVQFLPDAITPSLVYDLLNRMAEYKNLEGLDVQNAELDREVAESRYEVIETGIAEALQTQLQVEQTEQDLFANVVGAVMAIPILFPLPQENHTVATEFYRDKAMSQYKREQPDLMLIAACSEMIRRHSIAKVQFGQQAVAEMMAIQQPAQDMQMAQAAEQETQGKQAEMEATREQRGADEARADEDKNFQMGMKMLELEDKEADREHQKEMSAKQNAASKKK